MSERTSVLVFGEVLADCFPTGEEVLGGAPFNVAWHLQALGDEPRFISRVGDDALGKRIIASMKAWGMTLSGMQTDLVHPTGRVDVGLIDGEPHYTIMNERAYDFIETDSTDQTSSEGILYHGTLGVRNEVSRTSLQRLSEDPDLSIFLDVNLRAPWWKTEEVYRWLEKARWVKLNHDELRSLGFTSSDTHQAMADLQTQFGVEQLILTCGAKGAKVRVSDGQYHHLLPEKAERLTDTVGAGDAFSAMYIHALIAGWSIRDTLSIAQRFAGKVLGLRGATTTDLAFYRGATERFR